ncbi:MAG: hypothetical protein WBE80_02370 [Methylocella sp.]
MSDVKAPPPDYRLAFPGLTDGNHKKTSECDPRYNCIGFAAGTKLWWQPVPLLGGKRYWPPGVPQQETVDAYVKAFEFKEYVECVDGTFEENFEKIAIFAKNGIPKHAARQLDAHCWTSKLGRGIDIEHELGAIAGALYGQIVRYLKRRKPSV